MAGDQSGFDDCELLLELGVHAGGEGEELEHDNLVVNDR